MTYRRTLLTLGLSAACLPLAPGQTPSRTAQGNLATQLLDSFETWSGVPTSTPTPAAGTLVCWPAASATISDQGNTNGAYCLRLTRGANVVDDTWATYTFQNASNAAERDFSTVGQFNLDFYNSGPARVNAVVYFRDVNNLVRRYDVWLRPGVTNRVALLWGDRNSPRGLVVNSACTNIASYPNLVKGYNNVFPTSQDPAFDEARVKCAQFVLPWHGPSNVAYSVDNWKTTDRYTWFRELTGRVNDADPTGWVDGYGQNKYLTWTGKITADADLLTAKTNETSDLAANTGSSEFNPGGEYNSGVTPPFTAGTNYRLEKYRGQWWLVAPNGRLFWSYGPNGVGIFDGATYQPNRDMFQSTLPPATGSLEAQLLTNVGTNADKLSFLRWNVFKKYYTAPTSADIAQPTVYWQRSADRLKSWGMNTLACFSEAQMYQPTYAMPSTPHLSDRGRLAGVAGEVAFKKFAIGSDILPDAFDPNYQTQIARTMQDSFNGYRVPGPGGTLVPNPATIGYYVGNCVAFSYRFPHPYRQIRDDLLGQVSVARKVLSTDDTYYTKQDLVTWLLAKYGTVAGLNTAWGTSIASETALRAGVTLADADLFTLTVANSGTPSVRTQTVVKKQPFLDLRDWLVNRFAATYFQKTRAAFQQVAPGYLYLGCRFMSVDEDIWRKAAETCDVVSYNMYDYGLDEDHFAFLTSLDKPFIVSEYGHVSDERGTPVGVGIAESPAQRDALFEKNLTLALEHKNCVGFQPFSYANEEIHGNYFNRENFGWGFVDTTDTPYSSLIAKSRLVAYNLYTRRLAKAPLP